MDDLEQGLHGAGARWRAAQQPPPDPALICAVLAQRKLVAERPQLDFAAWLVVVAVVLVAGLAVMRSGLGPGATSLPPSDSGVRVGDRVVAAGLVVAELGQPTILCLALDNPLRLGIGAETRPSCSPVQVPLDGIDAGALPGASAYGETVVAAAAVVRGVWNGTGISVDSIGGAAPAPDPQLTVLDYAEPAAGASAETGTAPEIEAAYARLESEITGNTKTYAGQWPQSTGGQSVMIVATVEDANVVTARIRAVFPYAFCVLHVDYSWSELERALTVFSQSDGYEAAIRPNVNRLVVQMPVVDQEAADLLKHYPSVVADPLVRPDIAP